MCLVRFYRLILFQINTLETGSKKIIMPTCWRTMGDMSGMFKVTGFSQDIFFRGKHQELYQKITLKWPLKQRKQNTPGKSSMKCDKIIILKIHSEPWLCLAFKPFQNNKLALPKSNSWHLSNVFNQAGYFHSYNLQFLDISQLFHNISKIKSVWKHLSLIDSTMATVYYFLNSYFIF